jgi:hypothetical protein
MMAKKKEDRYKTMEELLIDLQAVRDGHPPVIARQRFNMDALGELQDGMEIARETTNEKVYSDEIISKYRVAVVVLIAMAAVLLLIILFLAVQLKNKIEDSKSFVSTHSGATVSWHDPQQKPVPVF